MLLLLVAALLVASQAAAAPSPSITATQAEAQQVVGEINALNASLSRSDELVNLANLKLAGVRQQIAMNRRELVIAKRNLAKSRRTIAIRLVKLYTTGQTSTLEVILGAQSLAQVMTRIDTANRVSSLDVQVATQVVHFKAAVLDSRAQLATERAQVGRLVAERTQERQAIEVRLGERQAC